MFNQCIQNIIISTCGSSHVSSAQLPRGAHSSKFSQRGLRTCIDLWLKRVPVNYSFSVREAVFQLAKMVISGRKLNVSWQSNQLYHFTLDFCFLIFSGMFWIYAARTCINSLRCSQPWTALYSIFHRHPISPLNG